jgi:hypothetical protein
MPKPLLVRLLVQLGFSSAPSSIGGSLWLVIPGEVQTGVFPLLTPK